MTNSQKNLDMYSRDELIHSVSELKNENKKIKEENLRLINKERLLFPNLEFRVDKTYCLILKEIKIAGTTPVTAKQIGQLLLKNGIKRNKTTIIRKLNSLLKILGGRKLAKNTAYYYFSQCKSFMIDYIVKTFNTYKKEYLLFRLHNIFLTTKLKLNKINFTEFSKYGNMVTIIDKNCNTVKHYKECYEDCILYYHPNLTLEVFIKNIIVHNEVDAKFLIGKFMMSIKKHIEQDVFHGEAIIHNHFQFSKNVEVATLHPTIAIKCNKDEFKDQVIQKSGGLCKFDKSPKLNYKEYSMFELEANSFDGFNAIKDTLSDIN